MDWEREWEWLERWGLRNASTNVPYPATSLPTSQFVEVNTSMGFPPECTRFPFIPNNCHVWANDDKHRSTLRPHRCGQEYRMDLYEGEKLVQKGIGGLFQFEASLVLFAFTHRITL